MNTADLKTLPSREAVAQGMRAITDFAFTQLDAQRNDERDAAYLGIEKTLAFLIEFREDLVIVEESITAQFPGGI